MAAATAAPLWASLGPDNSREKLIIFGKKVSTISSVQKYKSATSPKPLTQITVDCITS
jgi:hypothetical protein